MATIPYGDVHIATSEVDQFSTIAFITGDTPPAVTTSEIAAVDLPQWAVVARDASGKLIPAVLGTSKPIGITVNATKANKPVAAYRAGTFNPKALVWDASYDTDAKKKVAFEENGTQIFMVAPIY